MGGAKLCPTFIWLVEQPLDSSAARTDRLVLSSSQDYITQPDITVSTAQALSFHLSLTPYDRRSILLGETAINNSPLFLRLLLRMTRPYVLYLSLTCIRWDAANSRLLMIRAVSQRSRPQNMSEPHTPSVWNLFGIVPLAVSHIM